VTGARLVVVGGKKASRSDVSVRLPAIVGRGDRATVLVMHRTVSRAHCELLERDGQILVRDLGSKNGIYVGNDQVTEALLKSGDVLTIGPLAFRVEYQSVETSDVQPDTTFDAAEAPAAVSPTAGGDLLDVDEFLAGGTAPAGASAPASAAIDEDIAFDFLSDDDSATPAPKGHGSNGAAADVALADLDFEEKS
jgi:hypothetical protein